MEPEPAKDVPEAESVDEAEPKSQESTLASRIRDYFVPQLTVEKKQKFSRKKSAVIITTLYLSHALSAWGDRMLEFMTALLVVFLYPDSLLLPAIHGFTVQLFAVIFGTIVGDWVDVYPRMKVIVASLLVQNGLVVMSSLVLVAMFVFNWTVCTQLVPFAILFIVVILLGAIANLATVANTIAIERDWIVVLADGNSDTLAKLNATMRTIDLVCKLCSPIVAGVVLQYDLVYPRPVFTALFIGLWNFVSFFGELGLLLVVYRYVPTLAKKKLRTAEGKEEVKEEGGEEGMKEEGGEEGMKEMEGKAKRDKPVLSFDDGDAKVDSSTSDSPQDGRDTTGGSACLRCLKTWSAKLLSPYLTIRDGWRVFIRQDVARVGFSMASLYLTVLGLNGITATYFLTQGLPEYSIGIIQGIGGFVGILGTVFYPWVRSRIGTVRTGLVGTSAQLLMLLLCVAAVFSPGISLSGGNEDYYSAKCPFLNGTHIAASPVVQLPTMATPMPSSLYIVPTSALPPSSVTMDIVLVTSTPAATPMPSLTTSGFPGPSPTPTGVPGSPAVPPSVSVAVILMALGVVLARFGLWMYDLVVSQLVQETVEEEHRGVVSGVMNAMNSNMEMLQYILVLGVPSPAHFGYLTLVSVFMVTVGFLLYLSYARKVRGHLFHFGRYCGRCGGRRAAGAAVVDRREELRIMSGDDDDEDDEKL